VESSQAARREGGFGRSNDLTQTPTSISNAVDLSFQFGGQSRMGVSKVLQVSETLPE
jgi:hypothetical protein